MRKVTKRSNKNGSHVNSKLKHKEEIVFNSFADGFLSRTKLSNFQMRPKL